MRAHNQGAIHVGRRGALSYGDGGAEIPSSPLAAPVLSLAVAGDSYPPELSVSVDETYQEGDQIALSSAPSLSGTYTLLATATLDATAISTGILAMAGLSSITSPTQTWFKAIGKRTGEADSPASNVIKHGDVTGPTITSDTTQSQGEYEPMAYAVTANEDIERIEIIGGADAGLLEVSGTTIRLTGNADLNYVNKASYTFNFRTYDYGGNYTDTSGTLNVADEIPATPTFVDDTDVERSTAQSSDTYTLTGVTAGKAVPFTVILGAGVTYTLNGVSGLTAPTGAMQLGDTFSFQGNSSADYSTTIQSTLTVDGVAGTYRIATMANPDAASAVFHQQGVMDYGYGTACPGLESGSFAIDGADKLVVALATNFNGAAGDFAVTSVKANGGTVSFTLGGLLHQSGTNNAKKVYLFYADAPAVSSITDLDVAVNGSTSSIGYSIYSVVNAADGGPNAAYGNLVNTGATDPIDMDGGLAATETGVLVLCGSLLGGSGRTFIWSGAIEQSVYDTDKGIVSTAFQNPGAGGNVTCAGQNPPGIGFAELNICNALWEPA